MSKRKTTGLEWLELSMASFNGSGYADKYDANSYIESYIAFKTMKRETYALEVIEKFPTAPMGYAVELVHANDAGHTPSEKNLNKFRRFYDYETHKRREEPFLATDFNNPNQSRLV